MRDNDSHSGRIDRRKFLRRAGGGVIGTGLGVASAGTVAGQTRKEVEVKMSDGVSLYGQLFYPADGGGENADGPFPVILTVTPYNASRDSRERTGTSEFIRHGYIYAEFDVRGTGGSEGSFDFFSIREQEDYSELIHWLAELPRSTGRVGMYGHSYRGYNQYLAARAAGPESPLEAIVPGVTGSEAYRHLFFPGGMINEAYNPFWQAFTGAMHLGTSTVLDADERSPGENIDFAQDRIAGFYQSQLSTLVGSNVGTEKAYYEEYWQKRAPEGAMPEVVKYDVPTLYIGGWYDLLQPGSADPYTQLQNLWAGRDQFAPMDPDQPVSERYQTIIGPWYHSREGRERSTNRWARVWFDRFLKGEQNGVDETETPLHMFQVFGDRWVDAKTWPLPDFGERTVETYYFDTGRTGTAQHSLNDGALRQSQPTAFDASDELPWRRHNPCSQGSEREGPASSEEPCTDDERTFETGALTFTTVPFEKGRNLAGPISVSIFASTDSTNTSWVVALSVVDSGGESTLLSKGELLGSFRKRNEKRSWFFTEGGDNHPGRGGGPPDHAEVTRSTEDSFGKLLRPRHDFNRESEEPVEPGEVERYDISLDPQLARIHPGKRLRIAIRTTASWAQPLAKDLDNVVGTYNIQRNRTYPSHVNIPFVSGPLPESMVDWGPCETNCGRTYSER